METMIVQDVKDLHGTEFIKKKNQADQFGILIGIRERQTFISHHIQQFLHPLLAGFPFQHTLDAMLGLQPVRFGTEHRQFTTE